MSHTSGPVFLGVTALDPFGNGWANTALGSQEVIAINFVSRTNPEGNGLAAKTANERPRRKLLTLRSD